MSKKKEQPRPTNSPEPTRSPPARFPVVGIGASAGGLEALEAFFKALPADPGLAIVVVVHLDPTHISLLPDLLQKRTSLTVLQVEDGAVVQANHVHVIPPKLRIDGGLGDGAQLAPGSFFVTRCHRLSLPPTAYWSVRRGGPGISGSPSKRLRPGKPAAPRDPSPGAGRLRRWRAS